MAKLHLTIVIDGDNTSIFSKACRLVRYLTNGLKNCRVDTINVSVDVKPDTTLTELDDIRSKEQQLLSLLAEMGCVAQVQLSSS